MALLSMRRVCEIVPVSRPTIYVLMARERFPPPLRLGRRIFWDSDVVEAWLAAFVRNGGAS